MAVSVFQLNQGQDSQFTLHTHLSLHLDWNIIFCLLAMEKKENLAKSSDYDNTEVAFPQTWHYMRKKAIEQPLCFIIVGSCFNLSSDSMKVKDFIHEINRRRSRSFLWGLYECCFYTWKRWGFNAVALYKVCFSDTFPELLWMTGMCFWVVH